MNIPKFDNRNMKPWMRRHPFLARIYLLSVLPVAPFIYAAVIIFENRQDFSELKDIARAIFLPWKNK